jgi:hypothetical protein
VSQSVTVQLEEFLRTGEFGPVRLGMTRDDLVRTLGEPADLGGASRSQPRPPIWRYGDVEFHFDPTTELLHLVFADDFDQIHGALGLAVEPGWLRGGLPLEVALAQLVDAGLQHAVRVPDYDPGQVVLELESGVLLGFVAAPEHPSGKRGLVFFSQGPR